MYKLNKLRTVINDALDAADVNLYWDEINVSQFKEPNDDDYAIDVKLRGGNKFFANIKLHVKKELFKSAVNAFSNQSFYQKLAEIINTKIKMRKFGVGLEDYIEGLYLFCDEKGSGHISIVDDKLNVYEYTLDNFKLKDDEKLDAKVYEPMLELLDKLETDYWKIDENAEKIDEDEIPEKPVKKIKKLAM